MDLSDKYILVAGGAGGVGEGIVTALLKQGAYVFVPSRSESKLKKLKLNCENIKSGRLITILGDIGNSNGAIHIRSQIRMHIHELDVLVASLGGWWQGLLFTEVDLNTWKRIIANNLTSHFLTVKYFLPLVKKGTGIYLHINGYSAEKAMPKAGPVAMMAAAQKSMVLTLAEECRSSSKLVYELILGPVNTRAQIEAGHVNKNWNSAEEVGDFVYDLISRMPEPVVHYLLRREENLRKGVV
jgi:NAD(P)-dependent dehydrogenase (short-subunit alcohol dehydrogenase family)